MRLLLPRPQAEIDLFELFPPRAGLRLAMVMGADGAGTDERGWTAALGGPADKRVLRTVRAVADAILVGAGSIRTGRYPPHRPAGPYLDRRTALGWSAPAPLIVVSAGLELDWSLPAFTEATTPTIVLTCAAAPEARPTGVRFVEAGRDRVDLAAGLAELRRAGFDRLLCEGGPRLATTLLDGGLVDELCLTLAPTLVAGPTRRVLEPRANRCGLSLRAVAEEDGELFVRYTVDPTPDQGVPSSSSRRSRSGKSGSSTSAT